MKVIRDSSMRCLPELPPDIWGVIARIMLRAEDNDVRAWARLILVSRSWRAGLRGTALHASTT